MFTQSHGLESFVAAGTAGAAQIEPLLHGYLLHIAAPGDALAARWVARAAQAGDLDLVAQIDERLDRGAALLRDGDRFRMALVRHSAYSSLGPVDVDRRRADWQRAVET
jgi:hypothetical protein